MSKTTLSQQLLQERKDGLSEAQIAEKHNLTTPEIRALITTARVEEIASRTAWVRTLKTQGHSNATIARRLGINESSVRAFLKDE